MIGKQMVTGTLFLISILSWAGSARSSFDIQAKETVQLEIKGYNGLAETTLFASELAQGVRQHIMTSYRGLALLLFEQGQTYPVILSEQPFLLTTGSPDVQPTFTNSEVNEYFYTRLLGGKTEDTQFDFANLMIEAKQLLDATGSIRTVDELQAMKERFHQFARSHFPPLSRSDMLRRLISQYFMMHEYVDYHVAGAPATDIQQRYRQAVMDGVKNWLDILQPDIPQHEVLNFCVSLYLDRSMVTIASKIMEKFRELAYCPGEKMLPPVFPPDLRVIDADGRQSTLQQLDGDKIITFISDDCPVSKVAAVVEARRLIRQPNAARLIILSLQPLSENHLSLQRMVSGGSIHFVDDEPWRKGNLSTNMELPWFIQIDQ